MEEFILFEENAEQRNHLVEVLNSAGFRTIPCYSETKFAHVVKKMTTNKSAIVLLAKQCKEVFTKVNSSNCHAIFYDNSDQREIMVSALLQKISEELVKGIKVKRSALKSYEYDLICIGSSTGGFPVMQKILKGVNFLKTIVVLCQHINEKMSLELAETLNTQGKSKINLVTANEKLSPGKVYLLTGGKDFIFRRRLGKLSLMEAKDEESVYHPSFNKLLSSLADLEGYKRACIVLSGLGDDGSKHLKALQKSGVMVVAQDPKDSIAPYMPESAIRTGAVSLIYKDKDLEAFVKRGAA